MVRYWGNKIKQHRIFTILVLFILFILVGCGVKTVPQDDTPDNIYTWYQENKFKIAFDKFKISLQKKHPCIYVTTLDNQEVLSKETYVPAAIDVFNCDQKYVFTESAGIRVRGNSSAEGEKKPYRIKFDSKVNLLGLNEGKKYKSWVVLLPYAHLIQDYLSLHLADQILDDKYYSSDCALVNLYVNGEYIGVHVLCEQTQVNRGRIEINEPAEGMTNTDVGYLVELDNNASEDEGFYFSIGEIPGLTDFLGTTRTYPAKDYTVKSDIWSDEQKEFISSYITGALTILYEAAVNGKPMMFDEENRAVPADGVFETPYEAVDAVMDLRSLAQMMIIMELCQNYDVGAGSFYMAVDFSENSRYEKLTFLSPWDFSWSFGEDPESGYFACAYQPIVRDVDHSNIWYMLAMKMKEFQELVREEWRPLYDSGVLSATVDEVMEMCESYKKDLGESSWKIDKAREIVDFVRTRIEWLDEKWR